MITEGRRTKSAGRGVGVVVDREQNDGRDEVHGERELLAAVLRTALEDYVCGGVHKPKHSSEFEAIREVEDWIFNEPPRFHVDGFTSFVSICQIFDVAPDYARKVFRNTRDVVMGLSKQGREFDAARYRLIIGTLLGTKTPVVKNGKRYRPTLP
jgi:hypothetical protein